MMKSACVIGVAVSMFFAAGCDKSSDDWKGTIELVEGVTMVSNPEIPINGVVLLELEKALEINPFENPDIGIEYLARSFCMMQIGQRPIGSVQMENT